MAACFFLQLLFIFERSVGFSSPHLSASKPPIGRRYAPTKAILFQGCRGCAIVFAQAFDVQIFARKNFCMKAYYI
ncbi:hypothetical protein BGS_0728 [Beggiatoa sp. SS]|nr:hypothetical protein BGS_0728 [Beggiatoa sp. SS]